MHCYPDYYDKFKCTASKCKHNCCIGWEIDIDEATLSFYNTIDGKLGQRLKDNISYDDTPHFLLNNDERCPFLNKDNLCDIIHALTEEHLCDICREHPRFHNELPDRVESGIGLACEEACRLIITNKEKPALLCSCEYKTDDEIIIMRDKVISILQNRDRRIDERIKEMLSLCESEYDHKSVKETVEILLSLEILDSKWKETLLSINVNKTVIEYKKFYEYIKEKEHEYEQFCVYLIYRHFANAPDFYEAKKRARFVAFAFDLVYSFGAFIYSTMGSYPTDLQLDFMRMFSSEIEYSDENLHTLFDIL